MLEGVIRNTKAAIETIKRYLSENAETLTQQQMDEALDELSSLKELLEMLEGKTE